MKTNFSSQARGDLLHEGWNARKDGLDLNQDELNAFAFSHGWPWVEGYLLADLQVRGPLNVRLALRNGPEASRG